MKNKAASTYLSKRVVKSLSGWDKAILEAKEQMATIKRSIRTFEDLRDSGMAFPEPKTSGSENGHLGQK